jgi:alcohol dehydrogenase, propanol-preferring
MAKTMKAAVVRAFGKPLTIEEVAIPDPGPGEILINYKATGICHTDLHRRLAGQAQSAFHPRP